jgi:membrane protease YdiL (CAAX protease family)
MTLSTESVGPAAVSKRAAIWITVFISTVYISITVLLIIQPVKNLTVDATSLMIVGGVLKFVVVLCLTGFVLESCNMTLSTIGFSGRLGLRQLFVGFTIGAVLALFEVNIVTRYDWPDIFFRPKIERIDLSLKIAYLLLTIASPQEEIFFRGTLYSLLRKTFSTRSALIASSLLFGLVHIAIIRIVFAFINGLIFALLRERYDSLLAPIIAHVSFNFAMVTIIIVASGYPTADIAA